MMGKFIMVIGPSGSGKGTLIDHARPLFPAIHYPKSCTTRERRGGASDKNYYFLTASEFDERVKNGDFLEWAEYGGNRYGTLVSDVAPYLGRGTTVLKELEVQGVRQVRKRMPRDAFAVVFVNAGTWDEMEERIRRRADMSEAELKKRKERYEDEMSFMSEADFVVENPKGKVAEAKKRFEEVIRSLM